MASGRIEQSNLGYTLRTEWSSTSNIVGNYSTVTCNHYLLCAPGYDLYIGTRDNSCTCEETKSFTSSAISTVGNTSILLGTTTHTVHHDDTGKKTVNLSTTFNMNAWIGSTYIGAITASGDITLDDIPRKSVFRWLKLYTDTQVQTTRTIDDGIYVFLTKYSNTFYNKLELYYYDMTGTTNQTVLLRTLYNVNDNDLITLTQSELNTIYSAQPKSTKASFMARLYTYTDNTYTTLVDETPDTTLPSLKILQVAPTFNDFNYYDSNTSTSKGGTVRLTNDNQAIIPGYSTLTVSIPVSLKASANTRNTDMNHYMIDGNTVAYSSTETVEYSITKYAKENISVYAVDARGQSSEPVTKSFATLGKLVSYTKIVKNDNQSYSRNNNGTGEEVTLNFSGTWWGANRFGTNANAVTNSIGATYKFKKTSDTTYTDGTSTMTLTTSGTNFSFSGVVWGDLPNHGFDISETYDIIVTVSDELSSATYTFSIHSGEPAIAIYKNKVALGAAYDETLGGLQANGSPLAYYPIGAIYISTSATNPRDLFGGLWQQIEDTFLLACGTKYTSGTTGGSEKHQHEYGFQYGGYFYDTVIESNSNAGLVNYDSNNNVTLSGPGTYVDAYTNNVNGGNEERSSSKSMSHYRMTASTSNENTFPTYLAVYVWERIG